MRSRINTEHPDEAWKFVEYLGSKEGQERHAELGVAISAYEGTADLWVSSYKAFNVQAFVDMVDYGVIRPYSKTTLIWEDKAYEQLMPAFTRRNISCGSREKCSRDDERNAGKRVTGGYLEINDCGNRLHKRLPQICRRDHRWRTQPDVSCPKRN